ncbi:hypothetical protein CASFOL_002471 [Castilleja foliolosa]|uniref:Uncharacterized protein n=1 Tax=Castilleja foliolosa TaxID=1961234 RepID=A0ABD3EEP7_9LAMI
MNDNTLDCIISEGDADVFCGGISATTATKTSSGPAQVRTQSRRL